MPEDSTQLINFEKKYCPKCYGQFENVTVCPDDGTELRGPDNDPLIGKVFAERYEITSVLGLGGMSIVYKAKHRLMDRIVAIKMLHGNIKSDHTSLERFRLEAQAVSLLNHQNIITVYDFGVTPDSEAFFVMDFLDGESLGETLERKTKLPWERAIAIFKQICDGLGAAHKKGIIHRDMKPANVVLIKADEGSETVKLVDFGIAKMLPASGKQQQSLTKTGEVFGSPIYMSPEQCLGKDVDRHSDIYALGCLMYETLTGVPPHLGPTFLDTLNKHVGEQAKPIREVVPDANVPEELDQIIQKCLAKDPADRFDTAEEIRDHLSALSLRISGTGALKRAAVSGPISTLGNTQTMAQAAADCKPASPIWKFVAIGASVTLTLVAAFATLVPGTADDHATMLQKVMWQVSLDHGAELTQQGNYPAAEQSLDMALSAIKSVGNNHPRVEAVLRKKADLYSKWEGHAGPLEKVNIELANIDIERARQDKKAKMVVLTNLEKTPLDSSVARTSAQLKAEAEVTDILNISSKFYGRRLYLEQVELLDKALSVFKKLMPENSLPVARIENNLADGLTGLRRFGEVRPLLVHSAEVRKQSLQTTPNEYVRALSKLGQFDLDQSDIAHAEPELAEALKLAKEHKVEPELLVLCLRSYADMLRQTKRESQSLPYLKEANSIERKVPVG